MRLLFFLLLISTQIFAQERMNSQIPVISLKPLWSLTDATGWIKNGEDQWVEGNNKIQRRAVSIGKKDTWEKDAFRPGHDNFISFEVREITIDTFKFLIIIKKMRDGFYDLPSIRENWKDTTKIKYAVFKRNSAVLEDYAPDGNKMEGVVDYRPYVLYSGNVAPGSDYLNRIALQINSNKDPKLHTAKGTTWSVSVKYQELNDKKNCRFYIDRSASDDFEPEIKSDLLSHTMIIYYYECPKEKLNGLINLIRPAK